jgi:hypothetical protein
LWPRNFGACTVAARTGRTAARRGRTPSRPLRQEQQHDEHPRLGTGPLTHDGDHSMSSRAARSAVALLDTPASADRLARCPPSG